jgi:hypothetical protein
MIRPSRFLIVALYIAVLSTIAASLQIETTTLQTADNKHTDTSPKATNRPHSAPPVVLTGDWDSSHEVGRPSNAETVHSFKDDRFGSETYELPASHLVAWQAQWARKALVKTGHALDYMFRHIMVRCCCYLCVACP